ATLEDLYGVVNLLARHSWNGFENFFAIEVTPQIAIRLFEDQPKNGLLVRIQIGGTSVRDETRWLAEWRSLSDFVNPLEEPFELRFEVAVGLHVNPGRRLKGERNLAAINPYRDDFHLPLNPEDQGRVEFFADPWLLNAVL